MKKTLENTLTYFLKKHPKLHAKLINKSLELLMEFETVSHIVHKESLKTPYRYNIINYLLTRFENPRYLEIGVRNPEACFNKIACSEKYSVDPGLESEINLADFKMTSDAFFEQFFAGALFDSKMTFDVVFIDGLHLADQVDRDIVNAFKVLSPSGFVVLHDCNPPTEYHSRESYHFKYSPAWGSWNGTTWKAFVKHRSNPGYFSCCIDCDWGVGILSQGVNVGPYYSDKISQFFDYSFLDKNRRALLNLITYEDLLVRLKQ